MALYSIRKDGDPVLRKKAQPVEKVTRRVQKLIGDMLETMYAAEGVGLAAPQVGITERIIVVDVGDGPVALVNPVITDSDGTQRDVEGCLSFPGVTGYVTRRQHCVVEGLNAAGRPVRLSAGGFFARALQHEIDHLDGRLFIDYLQIGSEDAETETRDPRSEESDTR